MRKLTTVTVVGVLLGVSAGWTAASPGASGLAQEAGLPQAGTWVLNDELSDDPRAGRGERADGDARRRGGRPGFGGGPGGFGGRGGRFGGRGGDRPDPELAARMREAMRDLMTAARRMTIAGDAEEVVLTFNDGRVVRLIPDGPRARRPGRDARASHAHDAVARRNAGGRYRVAGRACALGAPDL